MHRSKRPGRATWVTVALALGGCGDGHGAAGQHSTDAAMAAAVQVEADGCNDTTTVGAGSFVADEKVLTVAHVVAGSHQVHVVLADGRRVAAKVVAIDRKKDLAVLDVDEEEIIPLPRGSMRPRSKGTFTVYRDGKPESLRFEAIASVEIDVPDIDDGESSLRRGYELRATVEQGDSGSVLVTDGLATGVVFARSTATGGKAWAIDITEAAGLLAEADDTSADVGVCVRGSSG
ncbi:MAG: trypsin-like peptidase domain-containing protein [Ilumatobacteraceae bacterium]